MILKKIFAFVTLLTLCVLMTTLSVKISAVAMLVFHAFAGIIGLAFYCSEFFRGSWNFAKTGILITAMILGYLFLLFYIFCAQDRSVHNRT